MNWKPYAAAVFLFVGCGLLPLGWMFSTRLWVIAVAFIVVGSVLMTMAYREAEAEGTYMFSGLWRPTGREMPGDIHGYSGQESGGRSTAWEAEHHSAGESAGESG